MVTCPPSKLRLIHYPFDASAEDVPGIGAHTDYECFTLLLADQPGLEVLNEDSDWIDAPPLKNATGEEAFVINIGDMLEV
jgi:isopenicillin N synthase-like dioxygenase